MTYESMFVGNSYAIGDDIGVFLAQGYRVHLALLP